MTNKQTTKPKAANGYVIYRGASLLDGNPIVAIAITKSSNKKTGNMVQTYILPDNGVSPLENAKPANLADYSVCGDCKHRRGLGGSCYVNLRQGVHQVFKAYRLGKYPDATTPSTNAKITKLTSNLASVAAHARKVRLGTYGDPMAVPHYVWQDLLRYAAGHTGYTHQWDNPRIFDYHKNALMRLCMASVDTVGEALKARLAGWRTFRVRRVEDAALPKEFPCPVSAEQNKRLLCEDCMACDGTQESSKKASPTIVVHGTLKKYFKGV
jgi:hypothetical protein